MPGEFVKRKIAVIVALALIAGCSENASPLVAPNTQVDTANPGDVSIYARAVARDDRTDADKSRDAGRKPTEVLEFFGIQPGMVVLDMYSGGGYYTELLARVVGAEGRVVAHTNMAYATYAGEEAINRYADDRLPNVEILMAENNELALDPESFDAIMMILAYHDIYYVAPDDGWPEIDGPEFVAELYKGLRPGGILAIVDHYASVGSPRETGNSLHRIDPAIVIEELTEAGFVLDAKSDVLRNMDDDHSLNMAAPQVRGRTDRFLLRFSKPQ